MRTGVVLPQTEISDDPAMIRDYAVAAEELGYTHILAYDHVVGAGTKNRPNWTGPYTSETMFHEPFVLFGYLAGITHRVELVTGVIILPQRQTALVAKQAAEVDVLSGGRLRLGVGIGWNEVEYEALNENFRNRAKRFEEQIEVLRLLFTQPVVDYHGEYHNITEAGLNPLPVQRPISIWIGASVEAAVARAGRLGEGWFPQFPPDERSRHLVEIFRASAHEAGRDPGSLGMEARIALRTHDPAAWKRFYDGWQELGATHIAINTMGMGLGSPDEHIRMIETFKREVLDGR